MYTQPARRRASYGLAGAHDRQIPADRHVGSRWDFLRRHEMEAKQAARGTKRELREFAGCLLRRAGDTRSVWIAIEHCADRGQAAGPNGLRPADLDQEARWELARQISPLIRVGDYRPDNPRTVEIDKGGDRGQRHITIQDLQDRVVERSVLQVVRPILQEQFLDCSMGYRSPGRSREEALLRAERLAMEQDRWIWISQDLRDAFDNVPRNRLVQILHKMIPADPICEFIKRIITTNSRRGIRQGGPLSPEMLNVFLHWLLDRWWQRQLPEVPFLRVADDLLILAKPVEVDGLYDQLEKRIREIGMHLKHSKDAAVRDLASGASTEWLGYEVSFSQSGLRVSIREKSWHKLEEHLCLAWEDPCPSLLVRESVLGWIGQQGAAYRKEDVRGIYAGIAERAREAGFDEIPPREEVASWWYEAHLRDWVNRRASLLLPGCSSTGFADGFAGQQCEFATSSRRGGVERFTDVPPQQTPVRREVFLYCDGSCLRPNGPGGWAYLLVEPETGWRRSDADAVPRTTNNRMELTAVIQGLESLRESAHVHLVVDSEYVHKGITEWLPVWESNGWRAGRRRLRRLMNKDLWQRLAAQLERHHVDSQWVRGHSGHVENEYVDQLAREAAERGISEPK